jgi:hypothetical protein
MRPMPNAVSAAFRQHHLATGRAFRREMRLGFAAHTLNQSKFHFESPNAC